MSLYKVTNIFIDGSPLSACLCIWRHLLGSFELIKENEINGARPKSKDLGIF